MTTRQASKRSLLRQPGFRLFLLSAPFLALVFLFSYLPLSGWTYAFFDYKVGQALLSCKFVGFKYFEMLASNSVKTRELMRVMRNTFVMSGLQLAFSWLPMIFSVMLYEIRAKRYRRVIQTLTTLPNFISWVLVYAVAWSMFSVTDGFVNQLLMRLGVLDAGINFLAASRNVWITQYLYAAWKGLGWNAVLYMAALSSIDAELYEAARMDGASRFHIIAHIEIPGLLPTYFVLLLLSVANLINSGMEQYFVFQNSMNKGYIEVLDLYVYNQGIGGGQISYSTAIGTLKSVVSVTLLTLANRASKLIRGESIL